MNKKILRYRPYKGGAGPTTKQIEHNNQVLMQELDKLKIPYKYKDISKEINCDRPWMACVISGIGAVSYDRWGYVVETQEVTVVSPRDLDQASLIEVMVYIKEKYETFNK